MTPAPLLDKLLHVLDERKDVRYGQMQAQGSNYACSLDWTKRNGEKAGGEWLVR